MMNLDACTHMYLYDGVLKHNMCLSEICIREADHPGISSMCVLHRWKMQIGSCQKRSPISMGGGGGGGASICMH